MTREHDNLRAITRVMDDALKIPGTRFRFGLDAIIGLIPGVGDTVTAAIAGYALIAAAKAGAPRSLLARMAGNILLDAAVGAVPVLGDLFDFAFKANRRNLRLLDQFAADPVRTRSRSRVSLAVAIGAVVAVVVGAAALAIWLAATLLRLLF